MVFGNSALAICYTKIMTTDTTNQRSFEEHSAHYAERFANPETHPHLVFQNEVIVSFLQKQLAGRTNQVLIDAACGTGDRLDDLFSTHGLDRSIFSRVIGLDYSPGMLRFAERQQQDGKKLYDTLAEQDLLKPIDVGVQADVILCLCEVTNTNGKDTKTMINNFAEELNPGGVVVYDILTTVARPLLKEQEAELLTRHPELEVSDDPQRVWYERTDGTIAHERLFSPADINELLKTPSLHAAEVWGHRHKTLEPQRLDISGTEIDELKAANYAGVLVVQTKV